MRSIEENLAWLAEIRPLPAGYTWGYKLSMGEFDKLRVVDPRGKKVVEDHITSLSDSNRWRYTADRLLVDIKDLLIREQYFNKSVPASVKLEDLGEKPERRAIEAPAKDKTKGFWGWLYK